MFHSETLAWAIHTDRTRDLERTARERRLMTPADAPRPVARVAVASAIAPKAQRPACGDSAGATV